ncbi:hypothetical protein OHB41_21060 [Streptomyces sp. NBC_01571]|uniref:hypothetical protein n=1 Tax=Streptomyces sp. NBC_01571 TaxID=2975883 RepID=UPI002250566C|nr:hypothetical protein [Streptomyces sp. NBC_01571]MCX4575634.1 hypothetical protein [Streptomyces sp. NBC_01571]
MGLFSRSQSSRSYPAAGVTVTGDASRFRRSRTTGARAAQSEADDWEAKDRARTGTSVWTWRGR